MADLDEIQAPQLRIPLLWVVFPNLKRRCCYGCSNKLRQGDQTAYPRLRLAEKVNNETKLD
jgi:hypothetical protein